MWLKRTGSTLDQCGVQADAKLWFTPMHKTLRVQMPDMQLIDMRVDFSENVFRSVMELGKELGEYQGAEPWNIVASKVYQGGNKNLGGLVEYCYTPRFFGQIMQYPIALALHWYQSGTMQTKPPCFCSIAILLQPAMSS